MDSLWEHNFFPNLWTLQMSAHYDLLRNTINQNSSSDHGDGTFKTRKRIFFVGTSIGTIDFDIRDILISMKST